MGEFDWSGLLSGALTGALGLGGSFMGASSSQSGVQAMNAANLQIAQQNRDWMTQMSNTAHQREVADLKAAGLNPILSATGGSGAAVPGAAYIPMQNTNAQSSQIMADALKGLNLQSISQANLNNASAKTEATKQLLNVANAKAAGGHVGIPGFASVPLAKIGDWVSNVKSNTAASAQNAKQGSSSFRDSFNAWASKLLS